MKQKRWNGTGIFLLVFLAFFAGASCSQMATDKELKGDIAAKAKEEIYFTGVTYAVADRVVTLTGNCPTVKAKTRVEIIVKGIAGVKEVVNNIAIAPVAITADLLLKRAADSVLKDYAYVQANVADSTIIIKGTAKEKEHQKLMAALQQLQPKKIADELVIK